jgi:hypothetical protein
MTELQAIRCTCNPASICEADLLGAAAEIAAEIEGDGLLPDRAAVATASDLPGDHPGITDDVLLAVERAFGARLPAEVPDGKAIFADA